MFRSRTRFAVIAAALLLFVGALPLAGEGTLIVLNKAEASASLIDLESGEAAATVATGEGPHEVAVSPDGKTAVVTNYGTREAPGTSLTVIDVGTARAVKTIDMEYERPHGIVWLADGKHTVVTAEADKKLLTVNIDSGEVMAAVDTDQEISHMVAITPDGRRAFVANIGSGSVTVIDLVKGERLANITTGEGAEGIDITPDGKEVWITNRAADTITVLDAVSLEKISELESTSFPIRAKVTPDGKHTLVSNARSGEVAVFDRATKEEVRRISMEHKAEDTEGRLFGGRFGESSVPIGILIRPDGKRAYVANANADIISILDLENWKTAGILRPGKEPDGMGFSHLSVATGGQGSR